MSICSTLAADNTSQSTYSAPLSSCKKGPQIANWHRASRAGSAYTCNSNVLMKTVAAASFSPSTMLLYSSSDSSCSWRIRFALNLKGLPYEYKPVSLSTGEQFTPEFERINPLHYVPALVDDGVVVSDSFAILMYLEDKYPQTRLLPTDPRRRAVSLQAASIVSCNIQPLHMKSILMSIEKKIGQEESLSWAQLTIEKGFSALEHLLKDFSGKYSMGDEVSMVDVFLAPQVSIAISRFRIDMSKYPTLNRVYESCKDMAEFQASTPERQPDARM